ncbi:MAG: hypothetical protein U9R15_02150 [Chloroflexota bacterium]|nr:hypothetical protein [Chloroflexota bacterium]
MDEKGRFRAQNSTEMAFKARFLAGCGGVAESSIRSRILKESLEAAAGALIPGCREFDPFEDTESSAGGDVVLDLSELQRVRSVRGD